MAKSTYTVGIDDILLNSKEYQALKNITEGRFDDYSSSNYRKLMKRKYCWGCNVVIKKRAVTELDINFGTFSSLYDKPLKNLHQDILKLKSLEKLNVSGHPIARFPDNIGSLSKLKRLYANGCNLIEFPESISDLKNLEELCLNGNHLRPIPGELGKLNKLKCLGLGWNNLSYIPNEIGDLYFLETLELEGNPLIALPQDLDSRLYRLKEMSIDYGKLFKFNVEMLGRLKKKGVKVYSSKGRTSN